MESSIHEAMEETTDMLSSLDFKSLHVSEHKERQSHDKNPLKDIVKPTARFAVGSPSTSRSPVTERKKTHTHKINVRNAPDSDPMFALDGFTDDCEPFFESEEEDLSSSGKYC